MNFPDRYDFKQTEQKWQKYWLDKGVYQWKDDKPREETFVIDTPPPTVSGILHMGHVYSYTQADFIARYQRMSGKDVFYPMGFDDNGLPTERLVEKVKKVRPNDLGREKFIEVCQEVVADAEKEFEALFNSIALSVDWRQKYETISAQSRTISQSSFLDLFKKGEVERKYQPMFWDPVDQTAIAQAEIVDKEMESAENYLWFGIDGSNEKIEIMTTRPEMLAACVAVMVHPDNFAKYKGKFAVTPLFNVKVPIISDEKVDKEKGTGFVMCCTFGDETDIKWWREHKLETKIILNKYDKDVVFLSARVLVCIVVFYFGAYNVENDSCSVS
jgi:valyl-tRNA synthetase